jgi:hypothetical protein
MAGQSSTSAGRFIASLSDDPAERREQLVEKLVEVLKELEGTWGQEHALGAWVLEMAPVLLETDLKALLLDLSDRAPTRRDYNLRPILAELLVEKYGGEEAWEFILELPEDERRSYTATAAGAWAETNAPAAFYAALGAETDGNGYAYVLSHVIPKLSEDDAPEALEAMLALPSGQTRNRLIEQFLPQFATVAPQLVREIYETTDDPRERAGAAMGVAGQLLKEDEEAAWEFIAGLDDAARAQVHGRMGESFFMDLDTAMERHARLPPGQAYTQMTERLARRMASLAPDEAWDWVLALPRGSAQAKGAQTVAAEMAEFDPEGALSGALRLPEGEVREGVMKSVLETWAAFAPEEAFAKLETLPEEERAAYRGPILQQLATQDVEQALAFARGLPGGDDRDSAHTAILEKWREMDGQSAARWSLENLEPEALEKSIGQTVRYWTMHDEAKAEAFVPTLPEGPLRDEGYSGLGWATIWDQPEKGMSYAASISEPEKRERLIGKFFTRWKNRDRHAAVEWLRESQMSPENKEELLGEDNW